VGAIARPHHAFQVLDVSVLCHGRQVRAFLTRDLFETHFGTDATSGSWLKAYADNERALLALIARKAARQPDAALVLIQADDYEDAARAKPRALSELR